MGSGWTHRRSPIYGKPPIQLPEPLRNLRNQVGTLSPLPDRWLAEIGPRVLWVIEDMGPNLLRLLENLCEAFKGLDWAKTNIGKNVSKLITANLERHPWFRIARAIL